jgi:hypothetical protein
VPAAADGTGLDEHVFARGNHRTRTDLAPRCLLAAIGAGAPLKVARGCGRLELADAVLGADDPLPARVLVNRVFHHLFGRGIARTVDNFGALGEPPTHPELLDRLARDCIADGWSLKRLVRRVLLSATYRQGSTPSAAASERDARNDLFTRQQLRRLSGEMVRDALLAVAGGLDDQVGGPPTPLPHDDEPEARGRPAANGPIDGAGRRSLYLAVRRNFLSPFLLAFDQPSPFATVGARSASNVPAQALALWNDPFVQDQCRRWAKRLAAADAAPQQAVTDAYLAAFARPPSTRELQRCCDFLADTAAAAGKPAGDADVLLELLHVLCNQKEFVFRP